MQELYKKSHRILQRGKDFDNEANDINHDFLSLMCSENLPPLGSEFPVALEAKAFSFDMSHGPYSIDFSKNGRFALFSGHKGHLSALDMNRQSLLFDVVIEDQIQDAKWLHNESLFAVAQSKYTYIYDRAGTEIHRLKKHSDPHRLEFLNNHFLLASLSHGAMLRYLDISTGRLISEIHTKSGSDKSMCQNFQNGLINVGHANGTITLWSPVVQDPLAKIFCHKGPVGAISCSFDGNVLATSGNDGQLKLWDLRNYSRELVLHSEACIGSLSFSQSGMLSYSAGSRVKVWKNFEEKAKPIATFYSSSASFVKFCPYEDILAIGHRDRISTHIVSGSGMASYDSFVANPFSTSKQRQESEIKALLDKLPPESIKIQSENYKPLQLSKASRIKTSRKRYLKNRFNVVDSDASANAHPKNTLLNRFY